MEQGYSQNKIATLNNGLKVQRRGYGTWQETEKLDSLVYEAIKVGYRHIDTAAAYKNEHLVGKGVNQAISEGIVKREDLFITTKVFGEKDNVAKSLNQSLQDLNLDYVDLFLIHWPIPSKDENTNTFKQPPLHVTWKLMEDLVKSGKTKSIGVSNFNVQILIDLLTYAEIKPVCNQVEIHPYLIQQDLISFCKKNDIEIVAYCPLGGNVPGKPQFSVKTMIQEPVIKEVAAKYNKTPAQIILNWHLSRGYVVIPKTATASRLQENFDCDTFEMTPEELQRISSLNRNARACDSKDMEIFDYVPAFA